MRIRDYLCTVAVVLLLAGSVRADAIVLKSGARIEGDAVVGGTMVRISNAEGTHRIRRSRLAHILRGHSEQPVSASRSTHPGIQSRPPGTSRLTADSDVIAALRQRISVNFDETPLPGVVEYLRETTEGNFSFSPPELATLNPLTLHLEDVSVRQVLDHLVEGRKLSWGVKNDIIRIREGATSTASVRVYDTRDLLLNVEDKKAQRTLTLAERGNDGEKDGEYGQWSREDEGTDWGYDSDDGEDDDRGSGATPSQPLRGRARDLGLLITSTVRPSTWDEPALLVIGGVNRDESEEALGFE